MKFRHAMKPSVIAASLSGLLLALPGASAAAAPDCACADPAGPGAWVARLGVHMLKRETGNQVVSPVSLVAAMQMLHASVDANTGRQLSHALTLQTGPGANLAFATQIPGLFTALQQDAETLTWADTMWFNQERFGQDLAVLRERLPALGPLAKVTVDSLSFGAKAAVLAAQLINEWASKRTGGRIVQVLPADAVNDDTQVVLVNALHFRSAWVLPFQPGMTKPLPFKGVALPVPTMSRSVDIMVGRKGRTTLYELDLASADYVFEVAVHDKGAVGAGVFAALSPQGRPKKWTATTCQLDLPRFRIPASGVSVKPLLQSLGLQGLFEGRADFSPLLGSQARGVRLDDVFQAAGVDVTEAGVEAAASTAAVLGRRSLQLPPRQRCAIDRPFAFAIVHKPSLTPVFMGRVVNPAAGR